MNLGEVKIQALALMYPDAIVRFDDTDVEGIEKAVYELKSDSNFQGLLESAVGSVNRALAQIEARGLSPIKCIDKAYSLCEKAKDGRVIIEAEKDFLTIERVLCHKNDATYACGYSVIGDKIYAELCGNAYTVVYYSKIPRVTRMTRESYEIDLPNSIAEAIPYFVMSELIGREDSERAKEARLKFFEVLDRTEKSQAHCHQCFQIVYSTEW